MPRIAAEQRALLLRDITCVVRCRQHRTRVWTTIAAFDVDVIAERYAADARRDNGERCDYEVINLEAV